MDFFEHQAQARRRTGLLSLYFVLAIVALVGALYSVLVWTLPFLGVQQFVNQYHGALWQPALLGWIAAGTVGAVAVGSLYRMWSLRSGGRAVAEALGGVLLETSPRTRLKRRLLHVVEEMSIASGVPRPAIYVLPDEIGINAFAAGHDWGDAAIAVSAGALRVLSREELQGVIAHEFSHIFHGDMRLNLRLLGLLHGIQVIGITGQFLLRGMRLRGSGRLQAGQGAFVLLGGSLYVIGWVGVFFAGLIKAAISRQREFLADASAVQYTRNPDGIGGALTKIGGFPRGGRLMNPREREISHFLFAHGEDDGKDDEPHWLDRLMSTHPALADRLARIYGVDAARWRDGFPEVRESALQDDDALPEHTISHFAANAVLLDLEGSDSAAAMNLDLAVARAVIRDLPANVIDAAHAPSDACALVYAVLISTDPEVMQRQHQHLQEHADRVIYRALWRLGAEVRGLQSGQLLPLLELLAGTLTALSLPQYRRFASDIDALIDADDYLDTTEFAVRQILMRHLDRAFGLRSAARVRYRDLLEVLGPVALTLSTFAWFGHPEDETLARAAFARAIRELGLPASTPLLNAERCTLRALGFAFDALRECIPDLHRRVLDAATVLIAHDQQVTVLEAELIRALKGALDLPSAARPH